MSQPPYDLLIRRATIVDGTGAPRYEGDVAVHGDRIARIGSLGAERGLREIDAQGLVVALGFIDAHTHDDRMLLSAGEMVAKVSQGVTTVIGGNCGISLAPMTHDMTESVTPPLDLLDDTGKWFRFRTFGEYLRALEAQPAATNCAMLVGHSTLRVLAMDELDRDATAQEVDAMRALVVEALEAGAIGVSTGLAYKPAMAASTEEVIGICQPLKTYGGLYCTHMRDEGDAVMDSLEETFRIGREVGVPVVISHHKVVGVANYGRSTETLKFIAASMSNQPICLDCYPYVASSTILTKPHAKNATRTIVTWSKAMPEHTGRDLADVVRDLDCTLDEAIDRLSPAGAIYYRMDEADVQRILQFPDTMVGSDGLPHDQKPHPRLWATFPRVLGHYSRGLGLFTLEKAVHKMTGLTASKFGLAGRGELKEGAFADLTLFDPLTVRAGADFDDPIAPAIGIVAVFVNGQVVWEEGKCSGARPGRVLRRKA
jgi:N-acyl-D-amino-acid deacylase